MGDRNTPQLRVSSRQIGDPESCDQPPSACLARAPKLRRHHNLAVSIETRRKRIVGDEPRAVEIDDVAHLGKDEGGGGRKRGAGHVANHDLHPQLPRPLGHHQCFGQAAAFIELDIQDLEATVLGFKFDKVLDTFVGGQRLQRRRQDQWATTKYASTMARPMSV